MILLTALQSFQLGFGFLADSCTIKNGKYGVKRLEHETDHLAPCNAGEERVDFLLPLSNILTLPAQC